MHARRLLGLILVVALIAGTGYMAYAAVTGGEYLVNAPDVAGCTTPGEHTAGRTRPSTTTSPTMRRSTSGTPI